MAAGQGKAPPGQHGDDLPVQGVQGKYAGFEGQEGRLLVTFSPDLNPFDFFHVGLFERACLQAITCQPAGAQGQDKGNL